MNDLAQLKEKAESLQAAALLARLEYNEALKASDADWKVGDVGTAMRDYGGFPRRMEPCDILITKVGVSHGSGALYYWGKWRTKKGDWALREHEVWVMIHEQGWKPQAIVSYTPTITEKG